MGYHFGMSPAGIRAELVLGETPPSMSSESNQHMISHAHEHGHESKLEEDQQEKSGGPVKGTKQEEKCQFGVISTEF